MRRQNLARFLSTRHGKPLTQAYFATIASAPRNGAALNLPRPAYEPARITFNDPGDLPVAGR